MRRKFEHFMYEKANEKFLFLAERMPQNELNQCVKEAFDRTIVAYPKACAELLGVYNEVGETQVGTTTKKAVYRDPRPDPSGADSQSTPEQVRQFIVNLAHSVLKATNQKFPGMKISSQFLAELFSSISKVAGKNIVDPERGGAPMSFSSTRDAATGQTAALNKNWLDVPGDKTKYAFNLMLYFMRYAGNMEQAKNLIRQSVNFDGLTPNYKSAVNKAITAAEQQYNSGNRQAFANPLPGAEPPAQVAQDTVKKGPQKTEKKVPKWKNPEAESPQGQINPPTLPKNPKEEDIDHVLDWYFNPSGYNKDNIKIDRFGNPTIRFAGDYMPKKTIKDLLLAKYKAAPTKTINGPDDLKDVLPDVTDKQGKVAVGGVGGTPQRMPAQELIDRLSGKNPSASTKVNRPEDLDAAMSHLPDDAVMKNPFGPGQIRKSDLMKILKSKL